LLQFCTRTDQAIAQIRAEARDDFRSTKVQSKFWDQLGN
jgi:hypothetical protein